MQWIYLSPHLDDAVYSCGSLIHQQVESGHSVEIWTIFAGYPSIPDFSPFASEIHMRWGTGDASTAARRVEDTAACARLGAVPLYFDFLDVIYRTHPLTGEAEIVENDDLFRAYQDSDFALQQAISLSLQEKLAGLEAAQVCVPLTLGNHIDHTLVRRAAEGLTLPIRLGYYADFPYVIQAEHEVDVPNQQVYPVLEQDVTAWGDAIALYPSQASTFWQDEAQMREELSLYWQKGGGSRLWFQDQ
jgi:LmbE family N-acetylglucosaminyl deacetylase